MEPIVKNLQKMDIVRVTGSFVAILAISFLSFEYDAPLFMASLGASAVILFAMPDSKAAIPRNVFVGHVVSAIVGISSSMLFGSTWLAAAIAVSVSIAFMMIADAVHPPGGATALIAVTGGESIRQLGWTYAFVPCLSGALILLAVALVVNNIPRNQRWPLFW